MEAVSKATAVAVANEIQDAVASILKKHGLEQTKYSVKYGDAFKFTMEASGVQLDENGINMASPDVIAYQRSGYAGVYEDRATGERLYVRLTAPIGTQYRDGVATYVFTGVRSRGKNKILMTKLKDGKTYVFSDNVIPSLNDAAQKQG